VNDDAAVLGKPPALPSNAKRSETAVPTTSLYGAGTLVVVTPATATPVGCHGWYVHVEPLDCTDEEVEFPKISGPSTPSGEVTRIEIDQVPAGIETGTRTVAASSTARPQATGDDGLVAPVAPVVPTGP
jgi:hypothetical protein